VAAEGSLYRGTRTARHVDEDLLFVFRFFVSELVKAAYTEANTRLVIVDVDLLIRPREVFPPVYVCMYVCMYVCILYIFIHKNIIYIYVYI